MRKGKENELATIMNLRKREMYAMRVFQNKIITKKGEKKRDAWENRRASLKV